MTCGDDLTLSLHAEGVLTGEEAWQVKSHVQHCSRCLRRLEQLAEEDRLLASLLDQPAAPRSWAERAWPWVGAVATFAAARVGLGLADEAWGGAIRAARAQWLNPIGPNAAMDTVFGALFFLSRQAMSLLMSLLLPAAGTLAASFILALVVWSLRRRIPGTAMVVAVAAVALFPRAGHAMTERRGETVVVVAGETINDSLLAKGESVLIDGVIDGDAIVMAERVLVKGTIKGNLISWSDKLVVYGTVEGTVIAGAHKAAIKGAVRRNALLFVQDADIYPGATVDGNLLGFVNALSIDGNVGRDAWMFSDHPTITGTVGQNVHAKVKNLVIRSTAKVGGGLVASVHSRDDVLIEPGAAIQGKVETHLPEGGWSRKKFLFSLVFLAGMLVSGLFLAWAAPSLLRPRIESAGEALRALGRGAVILIGVPLAALILCFTLVGLPIGLAAIALFVFALYVAKIVVAGAIGQRLFRAPVGFNPRYGLGLLVGLVLLAVLGNLPYVGFLVTAIVVPVGLGLLYLALRPLWQREAVAQ